VGAEAQLLPAERSEVFATADGVVAEIRAEHGEEVAQGDALVVLHAPDLQRDLQQASGNLATVRQRLAALQTARLDRRARERSDAGLLSLSAQQQEAEQQAADLAAQRDLLVQRAADLTLRSPRAGRVLTRDVQRTLANRPVRRGEALVTIANPQGPWELLAQAEQRHAGRLIAAWRRAEAEGVVVRGLYRLPGDVGPPRAARVAAISEVAAVGSDGLLDPGAPLEIRLVLDEPPADAARPGMHCEVKIDCGERPLAYVWFADLAAVLYRWWQL
jgi:multidrug efflux pump subunit AcrA (membrane-fusion protein)